MKNHIQALQAALVKLGYEYVRSTPGLRADEVNLTFLPPRDAAPPISAVLKLIAEAGLLAASVGIFGCAGRSALVLQGIRMLAASPLKSEISNLK